MAEDVPRDALERLREKALDGDLPTRDVEKIIERDRSSSDPTLIRPAPAGCEPTLHPAGEVAPALSGAPQGRPFGRYVLLQELGHGGMGVVWKAYDTQLRRVVALKGMIAEEFAEEAQVERFMREARAAARLSHPNIVPVYDVGEHEGQHYFTTEYIEGLPLDFVMKTQIPVKQSLAWVKAIAEGLHYAHQQGIVHRDVKPGNVLIDKDGQPHVMDFGLAKHVDSEATAKTGPALTVSGDLLGTPRYMSPEQTRGAVNAGPASDQFSLGAVMYELLTGTAPFAGDDMRNLLNAIAEQEPPRPTALNARLHRDIETICLKALEKDPARRYATLGDLAADIGRSLDGEPIVAHPATGLSRLWRKAARHRAILLTAAAALAVSLGSAVWAVVSHFRHVREISAALDRVTLETRKAEAALSRERAARETLEKSYRVSDVLSRFKAIAPAVQQLLANRQGGDAGGDEPTAGPRRAEMAHPEAYVEQRQTDLWREVDGFIKNTPDDAASRATMWAFAGWARWMATGDAPSAEEWMRKGTELDPDIPYGRLLGAMVLFAGYVNEQQLPTISTGGGAVLGFAQVPPETALMRERRERMVTLLSDAKGAAVWGRQGAEEYEAALEAMRAMQEEKYAAADAGLTRAIEGTELAPMRLLLLVARGKVRYLLRRFRDAEADFTQSIDACPGAWGFWYFRGVARHGRGEDAASHGADPRESYAAAVSDFNAALRLHPEDAALYENHLGLVCASLGRAEGARGIDPRRSFESAIAHFGRVLTNHGEDAQVYNNRGTAYLTLGDAELARGIDPRKDFERAIVDFDAAIARDPQPALFHLDRGGAHLKLGEMEEACGADPRGSYEKAIADEGEALARDPKNMDAYNNRGVAYRRLGDAQGSHGVEPRPSYEKAIADFGAALGLNAAYSMARLNRGVVYFRLGEGDAARGEDPSANYQRAIDDFNEVLKANPEEPTAYANRGNAYLRLGEAEAARGGDPRESYQKAIADQGEVLRRNPGYAPAYNSRGAAQLSLGDSEAKLGADPRESYRRAIADAGEAVRRNPAYAEAYQTRGNAYRSLGSADAARGSDPRDTFEKAIAEYGRAVQVNPRLWEAHAYQGQLYEAIGMSSKAVQSYEAALRIVGDGYPPLKEWLARAKEAAGGK